MNTSGIVIALLAGGVGAFAASVVWAAAWQLRIERAARAAEQQVFDAAGQQLTKVIGRARVPVYDVWERSALAQDEVMAELDAQLRLAAMAPVAAPTPVPSLAGTVLIVVQYLVERSVRWVRVHVVQFLAVRSSRRTPEHRGWDTPDGLAELRRLTGGRHRDQHRASEPLGVSR